MYVVVVPALLLVLARKTEVSLRSSTADTRRTTNIYSPQGKYELRGKRRGDPILEY